MPTCKKSFAQVAFTLIAGATWILAAVGSRVHASPARVTAQDTAALLRELDDRAAAAGSAAPRLTWPARIGLARLENGAISPIPAAEWTLWRDTRARINPQFGALEPVSALAAQSITRDALSGSAHDAITNLRLGAARQHLDALLIYEVAVDASVENTELTVLDATIVGAWWFPTHRAHATAHATATLIDVRTGLSYGSALGSAQDVRNTTMLGSQERVYQQREDTTRRAVAALAVDAENVIASLSRSARSASEREWSDSAAPGPESAPTERGRTASPPAEDVEAFWK